MHPNEETKRRRWIAFVLAGMAVMALAACKEEPGAAEVAAKYTEQTARAIIEGCWRISGAIIVAAFIRGAMNK